MEATDFKYALEYACLMLRLAVEALWGGIGDTFGWLATQDVVRKFGHTLPVPTYRCLAQFV